jgi:hypothetical protein
MPGIGGSQRFAVHQARAMMTPSEGSKSGGPPPELTVNAPGLKPGDFMRG